MGKLFGTDGVRGIVNEELTPELAMRLASSICTVFGVSSTFLVGRDVRLGGEAIKKSVLAGLLSSGCNAHDAGFTTTPALQYYIKNSSEYDGGIMVTASHNPPMYNGIKVIASDGIEAPRQMEKEIEEVFFAERFRRANWSLLDSSVRRIDNVNQHYVKGILSLVDDEVIRKRNPRVVIDCANSVGSLVLPEIVRKLGGKPLTINCNLDPHFPGREPEPTPETLRETSVIVKNLGADLGIGVDGDADRAIIISDDGDVKWGDRTAVILAPYLKRMYSNLPRRVYTGVSSSYFIEEILGREGIKVVWMKVGSVDISRRLVKENGLFGFEENGGFMFPEHQPVRDAGATIAYIMELLSLENKKISQLYDVYPKTYTIKTKVTMPREKALKAVEEISSMYSGQQMIRIDGVKVLLDNAWFLVRPSGTEPVLRIMIESFEKTRAEQILEELIKTVKKYTVESEKR